MSCRNSTFKYSVAPVSLLNGWVYLVTYLVTRHLTPENEWPSAPPPSQPSDSSCFLLDPQIHLHRLPHGPNIKHKMVGHVCNHWSTTKWRTARVVSIRNYCSFPMCLFHSQILIAIFSPQNHDLTCSLCFTTCIICIGMYNIKNWNCFNNTFVSLKSRMG